MRRFYTLIQSDIHSFFRSLDACTFRRDEERFSKHRRKDGAMLPADSHSCLAFTTHFDISNWRFLVVNSFPSAHNCVAQFYATEIWREERKGK